MMTRSPGRSALLALSLSIAWLVPSHPPTAVQAASPGALPAHSHTASLPVSFEPNWGQAARPVQFLAHLSGSTVFLTASEAVVVTRGLQRGGPRDAAALRTARGSAALSGSPSSQTASVLRLRYLGANRHPQMVGVSKLPGTVNYFIGNNPKGWHTNIPTYARVGYHGVYLGIDLVYYGMGGGLEYDWLVHPGASPHAIHLGVSGARNLRLDTHGNLLLRTGRGTTLLHPPLLYQQIGTQRHPISGGYTLDGHGGLGIRVGRYDAGRTLVIDPTVPYSSYLGGSGDDVGNGIAVDSAGNAYVTGYTYSTNFPTTNPFQGASGGGADAFITKINAAGSATVYSSYLGGSGTDFGQGIAVDSAGNAYVTGYTTSTNFPTTNPFQGASGGGDDAFVTKINASGSALVYSSYLGGSGEDFGQGIAVDSAGNAYVTGDTTSTNFPTTNPFQGASGGGDDAFITKIGPAAPTAVRIGRVLVQHRGAILRLSWRLSRFSGVLGFDLYAGRHRLNARLIPVHRSPVYRYQTSWRGPGPYRVLVRLTSGGAVSVPAR